MKFDVTNVQYEGPTFTTMLKKETNYSGKHTTWHTVNMCYLVVGAFLLITW